MEAHVRAGVAIFDEGWFLAAHDAWETRWLDLESGTDDERLLHGLIQYAGAVHHARTHKWAGATGLAESAREYLDAVPTDHRGVNVVAVRRYLGTLATDPEAIERARPRPLTVDGDVLGVADLDFPGAAVAAPIVADAEGYDEEVLTQAVAYAREDVAAGTTSPFAAQVFDFLRRPARRGLVFQRLRQRVDRRRSREQSVDGLF